MALVDGSCAVRIQEKEDVSLPALGGESCRVNGISPSRHGN
jgi:hypothetical protein